MFARSKPIKAVPLPVLTPRLPRNFADKVVELETQLVANISIDSISSLMQLYSVLST